MRLFILYKKTLIYLLWSIINTMYSVYNSRSAISWFKNVPSIFYMFTRYLTCIWGRHSILQFFLSIETKSSRAFTEKRKLDNLNGMSKTPMKMLLVNTMWLAYIYIRQIYANFSTLLKFSLFKQDLTSTKVGTSAVKIQKAKVIWIQ